MKTTVQFVFVAVDVSKAEVPNDKVREFLLSKELAQRHTEWAKAVLGRPASSREVAVSKGEESK